MDVPIYQHMHIAPIIIRACWRMQFYFVTNLTFKNVLFWCNSFVLKYSFSIHQEATILHLILEVTRGYYKSRCNLSLDGAQLQVSQDI